MRPCCTIIFLNGTHRKKSAAWRWGMCQYTIIRILPIASMKWILMNKLLPSEPFEKCRQTKNCLLIIMATGTIKNGFGLIADFEILGLRDFGIWRFCDVFC